MGAATGLRLLRHTLIGLVLVASCTERSKAPTPTAMNPPRATPPPAAEPSSSPAPLPAPAVIPRPVSAAPDDGFFDLAAETVIGVRSGTPEALPVARQLAEALRPATGFGLPVRTAEGEPAPGTILVEITGDDPSLGEEGYRLTVTPERVTLAAPRPAGLFYAVQTLRQLLPASIEADTPQPGPWRLPAVRIRDYPRFPWRGAMLDVARHFFGVEQIKQFIDRLAYYKLNRLHLHLTDDQGWRIAIDAWPALTTYGGRTAVGGDPGGFLTQADYAEIVAYAAERYIVVVPEIDMPGHTNAALASIPYLNCDGAAPPLYTEIEVGFSSLCVNKESTYAFVDAVLGELAAMTPGPYLHIGGDEAQSTSERDYVSFIERVQMIVEAHGKRMIGWEDIARARLHPPSVAQHWSSDVAARAVEQGLQVVLSPASRTYLDMQYDAETPLGLHWAGYIEVKDAYDWDPAAQVVGVSEEDILGVEAPLWTETIRTLADIDYMAFPRLAAIAEVGWSAREAHDWADFRERLAAHGPRLSAMGVGFYRSPQVEWK
jgi:hexosaminidase